jgi:glycosyltransferase involved in cell wall biosynthesis
MYKNKTISLVIPCLNEEKGIHQVLSRIPACIDTTIVVDNGSTDRTAAIASSLGAQVISETKKGYGRAYRTGFEYCRTDIIATSDGDGTYPVELIPDMVDYLVEQGADFVSGNRFPLANEKAMPSHLVCGNKVITLILCRAFGVKIQDGLSGMWIFYRHILDKLVLKSNRWSLSQEIKIETQMRGLPFREFHIPYTPRIGITKLGPVSVGIENMAYLFWHKIQWMTNIRESTHDE